MFKHTQTISWQQPTYCLSVFENFVELALKGLIMEVFIPFEKNLPLVEANTRWLSLLHLKRDLRE